MKILFLSHRFYPDIGGIEVNSEILADGFQKAGHDVRVMTWSKDTTGRIFSFSVIRNPGFIRLIREHLWADIIFENNPCVRLSWPALITRRPLVVALRTWTQKTSTDISLKEGLKRKILNRADAVIAVSEAVRKKCWPDAIVIGNPYRADLFKTTSTDKRNDKIVFLGRLVSDKGADVAIRALRHLRSDRDQLRNYTLTIIGDGPEKSKLMSLAKELALGDQIVFKGNLSGNALVSCLADHKFILVPSLWEEPFGNVALEGLACGCIPVVSDGGGLPDAIGLAGLVVPRGDYKALANCIPLVLNNQKFEKRLSNAALTHLQNHHPDVVSQKYLNVIASVGERRL